MSSGVGCRRAFRRSIVWPAGPLRANKCSSPSLARQFHSFLERSCDRVGACAINRIVAQRETENAIRSCKKVAPCQLTPVYSCLLGCPMTLLLSGNLLPTEYAGICSRLVLKSHGSIACLEMPPSCASRFPHKCWQFGSQSQNLRSCWLMRLQLPLAGGQTTGRRLALRWCELYRTWVFNLCTCRFECMAETCGMPLCRSGSPCLFGIVGASAP